MKAMLVCCKCGRILRFRDWVFVQNSFSTVLKNALGRWKVDDILEIHFLVETCGFCKEKEVKKDGERNSRKSIAL